MDDIGGDVTTAHRPVDTLEAPHEPVVPAPSSWRLWVLLLGGPSLWFAHFMIVYLAAEAVCTPKLIGDDQPWSDATLDRFVVASTVVAVSLCLAVATLSWRRLRREPGQWLWWVSITLGIGSALSVIAVGSSTLVVGGC